MRPCEASSVPGVSSPFRMNQMPKQMVAALVSCSTNRGTALRNMELLVVVTRAFIAWAYVLSHCVKNVCSSPSDLMVSRLLMPVIVTFCNCASVTSRFMASFF